jgi:hypothetical protein
MAWSGPAIAKVDARGPRRDSNELGPVVVGHYARPSPFLAVDVGARACEEAIVSVLEDRDPGRRFWVLEPLQVSC